MSLEPTGERFLPGMTGRIRTEHFHRYALVLEVARGKDVLDIASGEGYGAAWLAASARSVVGVDIDGAAVEHAAQQYRDHSNLSFRAGSCDAIPLDDASVDVVVSFETIEHHDKHHEMMREVKRVLRPDGLLLISSPNRAVYSEEADYRNPFHVKELSGEEFSVLLGQYFGSVQLYGQRMATASFVFPLNPDQGTGESESWLGYTARETQVVRGACPLEAPRYFLALCGEKQSVLDSSETSLYLDSQSVADYDHDQSCQLDQAELREARRFIAHFQSSRAWKLHQHPLWKLANRFYRNRKKT